MTDRKIRVAITHGDTNGIGYEIIFKAFAEQGMLDLCTPIIYGSPKIAAYHRNVTGIQANFSIINDAGDAQDGRLNMLAAVDGDVKVEMGTPSREAGAAALKALERAMEDYARGLYDVLVTAPINKNNMQGGDFPFAGHTEYIENRAGNGRKALMVLANDIMRVALLTTHLPVKEVAAAVTREAIVEKAGILDASLKRDFRVGSPRIAVLALNPHSGDGGVIGTEEREVIVPALEELSDKGVNVFGPYPADGFFGRGSYRSFDAVLAMYHDQGLAPFKALDDGRGVNFTAGLPIVRTSPDHGTAYDIAGKGVADEKSLRNAIYMAIDVFRNRESYDEASADPLKKLYHEKHEDGERQRFTVLKPKADK